MFFKSTYDVKDDLFTCRLGLTDWSKSGPTWKKRKKIEQKRLDVRDTKKNQRVKWRFETRFVRLFGEKAKNKKIQNLVKTFKIQINY